MASINTAIIKKNILDTLELSIALVEGYSFSTSDEGKIQHYEQFCVTLSRRKGDIQRDLNELSLLNHEMAQKIYEIQRNITQSVIIPSLDRCIKYNYDGILETLEKAKKLVERL